MLGIVFAVKSTLPTCAKQHNEVLNRMELWSLCAWVELPRITEVIYCGWQLAIFSSKHKNGVDHCEGTFPPTYPFHLLTFDLYPLNARRFGSDLFLTFDYICSELLVTLPPTTSSFQYSNQKNLIFDLGHHLELSVELAD